MRKKKLSMILNEGGYIDYRNIFRSLEKKNDDYISDSMNFDWEDANVESELPEWIKKKWEKYDLKNWGKE